MTDKQQAKPLQGSAARKAAISLINGVIVDGRLMSEQMGPKGVLARLEPSDRARAQRLAVETLRFSDRADRVLGPFLKKRPPVEAHNILRMAVLEICADGAAAHGVVNGAVALARSRRETTHSAGMINAVLRRVAEADVKWAELPAPKLPKWLRKPLVADYGKATVAEFELAHARGAPLDLSTKPDATHLPEGVRTPSGSLRIAEPGQVTALAGYDAGDWWVQDAAAALPVQIMAPKPGEKVLDLCAAPGGKTMQMAALGADVTAVDISEHRMARVRENLTRTKLQVETVVSDALAFSSGKYDAILLDAPCTATGTIRRHPDLPHAKTGEDFPELFALQERMIDHALGLLAPGGRLVFCTCSLLFDEGEIQVEDALKRRAGLSVDAAALDIPGIDPAWKTTEGGLRLRPDYWADIGGMDGFYIAVLRQD